MHLEYKTISASSLKLLAVKLNQLDNMTGFDHIYQILPDGDKFTAIFKARIKSHEPKEDSDE